MTKEGLATSEKDDGLLVEIANYCQTWMNHNLTVSEVSAQNIAILARRKNVGPLFGALQKGITRKRNIFNF